MHSLLDRKKKEAGVGIELSPSYSLPQAARMFSCVGCFWVLLSSALVAICSFSFISSAWIVKDHLKNKDSVSFGLLWHCSESLDHMYRCYTFGGLGKFAEIPSSSWQVWNSLTIHAKGFLNRGVTVTIWLGVAYNRNCLLHLNDIQNPQWYTCSWCMWCAQSMIHLCLIRPFIIERGLEVESW